MTYFKALSRYWCQYTDKNCRNVTLGGVKCCVRDSNLSITSLGVYRCESLMLLIIIVVINILNRTLTHSLTNNL